MVRFQLGTFAACHTHLSLPTFPVHLFAVSFHIYKKKPSHDYMSNLL